MFFSSLNNNAMLGKIFVIVTMVTAEVFCNCPTLCEWTGWDNWSTCAETCGTTEVASRERYICCSVSWGGLDQCVANCGVQKSDKFEYKDCGRFCYNGGTFNQECLCHERFYGRCCEERKSLILVLKLRSFFPYTIVSSFCPYLLGKRNMLTSITCLLTIYCNIKYACENIRVENCNLNTTYITLSRHINV